MRGRSHAMTASSGARLLRGKLWRCRAAIAKAAACWVDCRSSRASEVHSRI